MLDDRDFDQREVHFLEATLLGLIPGEGFVLLHHEVMKQFTLFGEKEVPFVSLVHGFHMFLSVSAGGSEGRRVRRELWHALERVPDDIAMDAIFFRESGRHGMHLFVRRLVFAGLLLDANQRRVVFGSVWRGERDCEARMRGVHRGIKHESWIKWLRRLLSADDG